MAKQGRPSEYTEEIAERICNELAEGKSLRAICEAEDLPSRETVRNWLRSNETFLGQYTRAREEQADHYADEIMEIADTATDANIAKLRIDARKWVASKLKSKSYGDKVTQEHKLPDGPVVLWGHQSE